MPVLGLRPGPQPPVRAARPALSRQSRTESLGKFATASRQQGGGDSSGDGGGGFGGERRGETPLGPNLCEEFAVLGPAPSRPPAPRPVAATDDPSKTTPSLAHNY